MKINVKVLMGEEHIFEIKPSDTVLEVKQKIHDKLGIEVAHQVLLLLGKALADENTVDFYPGIRDGSKLVLVKKTPQSPSQSKNGIYKFKEEMIKVLRVYYSDDDALTIANEVIKDLKTKVNQLNFDDLERLATAIEQER
ncbi:ubiquitin-like protein 4A [Copidosoma floridanum]|uniref:ubiquitin-like protein 4A n=1 Tax=Copidosoma floridanum TaxID=29053 RepID=UPI0006C97A9F|nr:ubiquitin-like protein 4A [Copidosoma floridanum]